MKRPRKISLQAVRNQDDTHILIYCESGEPKPNCHHSGMMEIGDAIARFGASSRLDELPLVCSVCGGRKVDVRPYRPRGMGGASL